MSSRSVQAHIFDIDIDIDGNGKLDPLPDGLLVLRHLSGFKGSSLSDGALAPDAASSDYAALLAHIEKHRVYMDADGDGRKTA